MSEHEAKWVLETLARWLRAPSERVDCPPGLEPGRVGAILERNRLLPLFRSVAVDYPPGSGWGQLQATLDEAYRRSLLQGLQQLKAGSYLLDCLRKAGIPGFAVRGPFLAEEVYGDVAMRVSSDVDILISARDRRRAWPVCQAAGFRSLDWECPLWPVDKHRIHWRIQRDGDPVVCELHWAVEPAYGVMTLDYEALLRDASITRRFLILCMHVGGHAGDLARCGDAVPPTAAEAMGEGMMFRWVDVAMFLRKYGAQIDWCWIDQQARDRRVSASLVMCLTGVRDWFGMELPGGAARCLQGWETSALAQRSTGWCRRLEVGWERRAGRATGMQTPLADVLYFLWPHARFHAPASGGSLWMRRLLHGAKAAGVLAREAASYSCFAAATWLRKGFRRRVAVLGSFLTMSAVVFGHDFGDDYGDTAAAAYPLVLGSNVTGRIEVDVDQDWFSFVASYSTNEYVVSVTTGTLWNSTAALAAPDGLSSLASTDSVASVTSRIAWVHVGPPAMYFVRIGGFASFTTGTYAMVVNKQTYADLDHDGMPDDWEKGWFQSTNQPPSGDFDHDGVSNVDEFLGGTNPTNNVSRLQMTGLVATGGGLSVSWASVPFRCYAVEASTNLARGEWDYLGTVTNLGALDSQRYENIGGMGAARFYRVRVLY